jgi:hypothetical protein
MEDKQVLVDLDEWNNNCPIFIAAMEGQMKGLERGCKRPLTEEFLTTLFYVACECYQLEVAKFLLAKGAKPSIDIAVRYTIYANRNLFYDERQHDLFLWLFDIADNKKQILERIVEDDEERIVYAWEQDNKTTTQVILEDEHRYHQLVGCDKMLISEELRQFLFLNQNQK